MAEQERIEATTEMGPSGSAGSDDGSRSNGPVQGAAGGSSGQPQGTSGMAVASLVLGIIGVVTSFMPIINNVSFFLGILGVIFAIVGIVGINKGNRRGRGLAIAGLVLGIVAIVVTLIAQSFYGAVLDEVQEAIDESVTSSSSVGAGDEGTNGSSESSESGDAAADPDGSAAADAPYSVTIDGAEKVTDYGGDPAVVITYTWTNDSDKATSFIVALNAECFQNGVECSPAVVSGLGTESMNEVKPGATATVKRAYALTDSSPITVEVSELLSMDDVVLAEAQFDL